MSIYSLSQGSLKTIERLIPRLEKQNPSIAAVALHRKMPVLRRGPGAGKLVELQVDLQFEQCGQKRLTHCWPNNAGTLPPVIVFSLSAFLKPEKALRPERVICFSTADEKPDADQPPLAFVSGDADVPAHGYIYAVEEGPDGTQIAWFVFIFQEDGVNRTSTWFGHPDTLRVIARTVANSLSFSAGDSVGPHQEQRIRREPNEI